MVKILFANVELCSKLVRVLKMNMSESNHKTCKVKLSDVDVGNAIDSTQ